MCSQKGYLYSTEPVNSKALTVKYTDKDTGNNSVATFRIESGNIDNSFRIDANTGDIFTTKSVLALPLLVNLTINITDRGVPPLSSTAIVYIELIRLNNSEPVFLGTPYSANISEDTSVGTSIFQVSANDTDPLEAGELVFSLSRVPQKAGQDIFKIDADNGVISLEQSLDYELVITYQILVTATDKHKRRPKSTSVNMTIYVLDVNDNSPQFEQTSYTFDVSENQTLGHTLILLQNKVSDKDSGSNKQLTFGVYPPADSSFSVNNLTGAVEVAEFLSRKVQNFHVLYVYAIDGGKPQRRANVTININVIEVNDEAPVMILPTKYSFFETNGTTVGKPFLTLNITDQDAGLAGNVSLIMLQGNSTLFGVQEYGYGIYYNYPLNFEVSLLSVTSGLLLLLLLLQQQHCLCL